MSEALIALEKLCKKIGFMATEAVTHLFKYLEESLSEWKDVPINIAVRRKTGAGKSTFINTIRGILPDMQAAATVGTTETTLEPTAYNQAGRENLVYWDLPGVGTPRFPTSTYLEQVKWEQYDFFLILCNKRFTKRPVAGAKYQKGEKAVLLHPKSH